MELEVEKDVPCRSQTLQDLGTGADEKLQADLEDAHPSPETLREIPRLGGVVNVEGKDNPPSRLSFRMRRFSFA